MSEAPAAGEAKEQEGIKEIEAGKPVEGAEKVVSAVKHACGLCAIGIPHSR